MRTGRQFLIYLLILVALLFSINVLVIYLEYQASRDNIEYGKLVGGSNNDLGRIIEYDRKGNYFIAGWTDSTDFPVSSNKNTSFAGDVDIFISKFDSTHQLIDSIYFGGSGNDQVRDLVIDSEDNIIIVGDTDSEDFPVTNDLDLFNPSFDGEKDGFVTKFDSSLSYVWSTFIGGFVSDFVSAISVDSADFYYITGFTNSENFVSNTPGGRENIEDDSNEGEYDAFVIKMRSNGEKIWNYFLSGSDYDLGYDIEVDQSDVYVAGYTISENFPTFNSENLPKTKNKSIFLAKLNLTGGAIWSKIFGVNRENTTNFEFEDRITIDVANSDTVYVGGWTTSRFFLGIENPGPEEFTDEDGFISKLTSSGEVIWTKFYGGENSDKLIGLKANFDETIYAVGSTNSYDFHIENPILYSYQGFGDGFAVHLDSGGNILSSTYWGGSFWESNMDFAINDEKNLVIAGFSSSSDLPTTSGDNVQGYIDVMVWEISFGKAKSRVSASSPSSGWGFLYIFVENTSLFEWIMIFGAIVFALRVIDYYNKTKIRDFLLFLGLFISIAIGSFLQSIVIFSGRFLPHGALGLLRQPQLSMNLTVFLVLIHATRLKWEIIPNRVKFFFASLLLLKLATPGLLLILRANEVENQNVSFALSTLFLLFDLSVLGLVIYAYFTVNVINPTPRIRRAHFYWKITWIMFFIGYLLVVVLLGLQIFLLASGASITSNLSIVENYRTLNAFMNSGLYFFIIFIAIGFIAVRYPEGLLISHTQFSNALQMYSRVSTEVKDEEKEKSSLLKYIEETKKLMELEYPTV